MVKRAKSILYRSIHVCDEMVRHPPEKLTESAISNISIMFKVL